MKKRRKILLSLAIALIMVFALAATALADDYSNHWSNSFVKDAIAKGWIATDANGNVQPDALATRGSYALMMWKSLGSPIPTKPNPFTDVPDTSPYYNAVRALYEAGITTGMTETTFGPDVNLNREMACTMLVRAHKLSPTNANAYQQFADYAQISDWARNAISAMLEGKYIEGIGNNMFAPKQNLKNGEMIKIVMGVANGMVSAQQNAAAALAAMMQQQNSATLSIKLSLRIVSSQEAYVIIDASDSSGSVDFIGIRLQQSGDGTYTDTSGFKSVSNDEFLVEADGTYVVCVTNKKGGFKTETIKVTGLNKNAPIPTFGSPDYNADKTSCTIAITPGSGNDILGYIYSSTQPTKAYTSSDKFSKSKISGNTLTVDANGWYVVGVKNSSSNVFGFAVCKVTGIDDGTTYEVKFDSNGGSSVASQTVVDGKTVTEPNNPTRDGYTFGGWYEDSALTDKWSFSSDKVTKNITLYAKWNAITPQTKYTVTFDSNGGTPIPATQEVDSGDYATKPTNNPALSGSSFKGWFTSATGGTEWNFASDKVTKDITLYAQWEQGTVTPPTAPTNVTFTFATADGEASTTSSTKIVLVFNADIDLTVSDINISDDTGSATKGELTGSGKNWSIAISDIKQGDVTVTVSSPPGYTVIESTKTVAVYTQFIISTSSLPKGTVDKPYYEALTTSGGTEPIRWSITNGELPEGLELNEYTGVISGIPTTNGTLSVDITATDSIRGAYTKSYEIIIDPVE